MGNEQERRVAPVLLTVVVRCVSHASRARLQLPPLNGFRGDNFPHQKTEDPLVQTGTTAAGMPVPSLIPGKQVSLEILGSGSRRLYRLVHPSAPRRRSSAASYMQ